MQGDCEKGGNTDNKNKTRVEERNQDHIREHGGRETGVSRRRPGLRDQRKGAPHFQESGE